MSFHRTRLRALAACLLLGWLFAFGVSVAHACGLTPSLGADGHEAAASAAEPATAPAPPADNTSCVRFCEDGNKSATGSGTIATAAPAHLIGVAPWRPWPDPDVTLVTLRSAWMREQGWRPARELSIELQRLTL